MTTPKTAYLILAHTDPKQLERLTNAINYQARIFIHLDKKANHDEFKDIKLPHTAQIIQDRFKIYWGGISMIKATLSLIKAALNSEDQYSHLVLLCL
jgi:hypothetical protein